MVARWTPAGELLELASAVALQFFHSLLERVVRPAAAGSAEAHLDMEAVVAALKNFNLALYSFRDSL